MTSHSAPIILAAFRQPMAAIGMEARASTRHDGTAFLRRQLRRSVERNACGAGPDCIEHSNMHRIGDRQAWAL